MKVGIVCGSHQAIKTVMGDMDVSPRCRRNVTQCTLQNEFGDIIYFFNEQHLNHKVGYRLDMVLYHESVADQDAVRQFATVHWLR